MLARRFPLLARTCSVNSLQNLPRSSKMTLMAAKFTPEVLVSAPRRSAGVPNSTGTKALFTVSTYSLEQHEKTSQIRVLDIDTGQSTTLYEKTQYREPTWLTETEFAILESGDKGKTNLLVADAAHPGADPAVVATFPGSLSNLKIKRLPDGTFALAGSAPTTPGGAMAAEDAASKPRSSAKVYDGLFVRHWDAWLDENHSAIWYGSLRRTGDVSYELSPSDGLINALAGTPFESPVPPFGGSEDFDLGPSGLVFVAKDPHLNPACYTKTDLYYLALSSYAEKPSGPPREVRTGSLRGYSANPVFSHSGKSVAFTRMRSDQYESDKSRLLIVGHLEREGELEARELHATDDGEGAWDARPGALAWSADDAELYATVEERGRTRVAALPATVPSPLDRLRLLDTGEGSVSRVGLLADDGSTKLFFSASSLIDSSFYGVVDPGAVSDAGSLRVVSSLTRNGKTLGLSRSQVDEFWCRGAGGDYDVHALVVKPSNFDASTGRKYPLAFLIHGGPQGAWTDAWSTRWNPAVFAEQGYVVVCPNPTGSTGYGMALQDGITGDWGGKPYNDLVRCFEHVVDNLPYVDTDRAVALGASYGGYMINWIQGHPLGRKFKALVCHDGVFSTLNQWSTEELFFPIHDFEGTLWENREGYAKWDPAAFTNHWATPELVIHSELDYRLAVTEGLAAFNVLQARGVPSRLLVFPDENHWVLKPENSLVWHREVLGWINKYSGVGQTDSKEKGSASERVVVSR